jgi:hypothetical protein
MTKIPQIHKLSKASQMSLLAVVILLGAILFTVSSALQQQNGASNASGTTCYTFGPISTCNNQIQPIPTTYFGYYPTSTPYRYPTPISSGQYCKQVWTGFTYTTQCYTPTPLPPTPRPIATPTPVTIRPTCAPPPTCYSFGRMICVEPIYGWCNVTPPVQTATPTPVVNPTIKPTWAPTLFPTAWPTNVPTSAPTAVPQPTSTPAPGSTLIAVTVGLQGIGLAGDNANPGSQGNMNPLHPSRTITADVYDSQNQLVVSEQGTVIFDKSSGMFKGTVNLGDNFVTGSYTVKIKTDQYLRSLVSGIQTITSGQTTTLPQVSLIAGDINGDNQINIVDYNILIGCYSDLLPAANCTDANKVLSDLDDDGYVNQFDYNLFLRELSNVGGQ